MDRLRTGEIVAVGNGKYERVYGFGHYKVDRVGKFLQIETTNSTLTLSSSHMVFLYGRHLPVPASLVACGDNLVGASGEALQVISINEVEEKGLYAPFTPSGILLVNDMLVSSFVAFEESQSISIFGWALSYQWLARTFEFPHRLLCHYVAECLDVRYDTDGISFWVATPLRLTLSVLRMPWLVRNLILGLVFGIFAVFQWIELVLIVYPAAFVALCVGYVVLRERLHTAKK